MEINEKIVMIDKSLKGLISSNCKTIPELVDGFQNFPLPKSDKDSKYRIIENELISLGLAEKIRGGDNTTIGGYIEFKLTSKGLELIESKKSVKELYDQSEKEKGVDSKIKEYTLEKLEYEKTIRNQEQRIRDLTEQLKTISLLQKYWWVLVTFFGLGYSIAKVID
jgi:hypothetical protein